MSSDSRIERWALIAALATSEQAQLAAKFRADGSPSFTNRKISYNNIEPDFVGTEVEHTALLNGLRQHAPEINEAFPVQELRAIKEHLLAVPVE